MEKIVIIGKSRTGNALAQRIRMCVGFTLVGHIAARAERYRTTDAQSIIIATRDDYVPEVAARAIVAAPNAKRMIHLAGAVSPDVLPLMDGLDRMTLHPIQTFARKSPNLFDGITWAASSDSHAAIAWAKRFVRAIHGVSVLTIAPDDLAAYHATSVFAANFPVLLAAAIEQLAISIHQRPSTMKHALSPLVKQMLENLASHPASAALGGPLRRGDIATIKRHELALKHAAPDAWNLYAAFVEYARSLGLFGETERR